MTTVISSINTDLFRRAYLRTSLRQSLGTTERSWTNLLRDHAKADTAWNEGRFDKSIIPVKDADGNYLERDQTIRSEPSAEGLTKLNPAFQKLGDMD